MVELGMAWERSREARVRLISFKIKPLFNLFSPTTTTATILLAMTNKKHEPNTSNKHDQAKQPDVAVKNPAASSFNPLVKPTFTPPDAKTIQPNKKQEWRDWADRKRQEADDADDKKDYPKAVALYTEIINSAGFKQYLDKKLQAKTYYNRGCVYSDQGKFDLAIADYTKAIELKTDLEEAYNNRGNAYAAQGKFDLAIADFNTAIELKPDNAVAYNNRGEAYREQDNFEQAIADYNKAIKFNPHYAPAYHNLGLLLTRHRDHETGKYQHNLTTDQRKNIEDKLKTIEISSIHFGHALLCSYFASHSNDEQKKKDWSDKAKEKFETLFSAKELVKDSIEKTTLYKFKPLDEHVFTELVLKQLFLNDPTQWNDPFDARMFAPFRVPEYQEQFKYLRMQSFCVERDADDQGFPKDPLNNFLMWSHYADEHQGVCLVYDYQKPDQQPNTAAAFLHPVKYNNQPDLKESHDFYLMKYEQWRYENEYRLVHMMERDDAKLKEPCLLDYKDIGLTLKAIFFGSECSTTRIKMVKAFIKQIGLEGKIALYQMKNDGVKFVLDREEIKKDDEDI